MEHFPPARKVVSGSANSNNAPVFLQVDHQRALDRHHFAQVQLRTATQQWHRDHEQLQARALVTLEEARHAHQEELEHHRDRQHQLDVCSQLREKVCECDNPQVCLSLLDQESSNCGSLVIWLLIIGILDSLFSP